MVEYLAVNVLVNKGSCDCTNMGLTSKYKDVILFKHDLSLNRVNEIIKEKNLDKDKCLQVIIYNACGEVYKKAVPIILLNSNKWVMFGGHYLITSDSRYKELTNNLIYPIPVHDRVEEYQKY